jgi:hypothetical protein
VLRFVCDRVIALSIMAMLFFLVLLFSKLSLSGRLPQESADKSLTRLQ